MAKKETGMTDGYIEKLVKTLRDQRVAEYTQRNLDPNTDLRYYPRLPESDRIYSLEKNKAITSLQVKLRNTYKAIKDLQTLNPTNNSLNLTWTAPANNGTNLNVN